MAIYMTAQWQCRNGEEQTVASALVVFVRAVGQNETGTRLYTALQNVQDPYAAAASLVSRACSHPDVYPGDQPGRGCSRSLDAAAHPSQRTARLCILRLGGEFRQISALCAPVAEL